MALDSESFDVAVDADNIIRCYPCGQPLKPKYITLMIRREPGGPFYPMCVECAREVLQAAQTTLAINAALEQALN